MDEFGPDCIIISIKDGTGKGESFVDSDKWRYCDA